MKIWKAIRTAAAESEKQQQDDAQNGAQSGESVQAGISSQDAEKAVTEGTGRQEEGEKELPAEAGQDTQDIRKMIFEKQEYEERIWQIADMTGADPDLIKSRIEEYAKMKEKTPLEAANEVKAALHLRDAYVEAAKAANEMMQDLARRLGEAFDQLGDIVGRNPGMAQILRSQGESIEQLQADARPADGKKAAPQIWKKIKAA